MPSQRSQRPELVVDYLVVGGGKSGNGQRLSWKCADRTRRCGRAGYRSAPLAAFSCVLDHSGGATLKGRGGNQVRTSIDSPVVIRLLS